MKLRVKMLPPQIDYSTGQMTLLFAPKEDTKQMYEELKDCEELSLEIKKYRERRSLNANSYFHVLVGKIAKKQHVSNQFIKNKLISEYGQLYIEDGQIVHMIVRDDIDVTEWEEIHLSSTTAAKTLDDGKLYRVYRVMRGTHTYDSEEMAHLIDGTIYEAKEAGLTDREIATPDELAQLKERYGIEV